jgi:hypothetical protein
MGMEVVVPCERVDFPALLGALAAGGHTGMVAMVDGALVLPTAPVPDGWRDVRLRFAPGMITLARRPGGVAIVVFGNAGDDLRRLQEAIAAALRIG